MKNRLAASVLPSVAGVLAEQILYCNRSFLIGARCMVRGVEGGRAGQPVRSRIQPSVLNFSICFCHPIILPSNIRISDLEYNIQHNINVQTVGGPLRVVCSAVCMAETRREWRKVRFWFLPACVLSLLLTYFETIWAPV